jgi:aminoglycoside phosphotransferase (APT) family kinase protein
MDSEREGPRPNGPPLAHDPVVLRAYASHAVAGCSADRVLHVAPCGVGENHAVYRLSYVDPDQKSKDVVIRIAISDRARDAAAAKREAAVLTKLQGVAAPVLHDFRCDNEWFDAPVMCMDFIQGVQRSPHDLWEFERLGHVLATLHALPTDDLAGWWPDAATVPGYLETRLAKIDEKLPSIRDPLPAPVQDRFRQAQVLLDSILAPRRRAASFAVGEALSLLHGDVAGGNIIWTSDPVLIDWEYARVGDPADEVAYVFARPARLHRRTADRVLARLRTAALCWQAP